PFIYTLSLHDALPISTVYSQTINFNKDANSKVINFTLPANNVGVSTYKAYLTPLESEKNKVNNTKNFAVEIIDQKTKVALVSDLDRKSTRLNSSHVKI